MKADLKALSCDVFDINNSFPENPNCFCLTILAKIGVDGEMGGGNFDFFVCTPEWIKKYASNGLWGKNYLIVNSFDVEGIRSAVVNILIKIEADNWNILARKISRFMDWEYEDYQS